MKYIIFVVLTALLPFLGSKAFCQTGQWGKTWIVGGGVTYTTTFQNSQCINALLDTTGSTLFDLGNTSISDSLGDALFCSDGMNLYDRHANLVENGDTLVPRSWYNIEGGYSLYPQSSILLPFGSNQYGLITGAASDSEIANCWGITSADFDLLLLHRIDGAANGGLGKVVRRAIPMINGPKMSRVQMTACRHEDGNSWWVLKQAKDSNRIYRVLVKKDTVYGPWSQNFPFSLFHSGDNDFGGQSVVTKDGTRYATTARVANKVFVADFNRCTGLISNPKAYDVPSPLMHDPNNPTDPDIYTEGVAFSPNGRYLYVIKYYNVVQLDLQDNNPSTQWAVVAGLDTTWDASMSYSSTYLGPDDKIYIGNWAVQGMQMSVFNTPNGKGSASGFCPKCLRFLPWYYNGSLASAVGTPPNITNYSLGAAPPGCIRLGVNDQLQPANVFTFYPNPTTGILTIEYSGGGTVELLDILGRVQRSIALQSGSRKMTIDLSDLTPGVYTYRRVEGGRATQSGKLVIVK